MEKIFICIFLLAVVPYAGLPYVYDTPIYVVLLLVLGYCVYAFLQKNLKEMEIEKEEVRNEKETTEEVKTETE